MNPPSGSRTGGVSAENWSRPKRVSATARDLEQASDSTGEKEAIIRNALVAVTDAVAGAGRPRAFIKT